MIGKSNDDPDPASRFKGQLCAVFIHRGPESDTQITTRIDALRAKFPPK
ncbi:MAG: hypothetical protein JWM74_364 [Myxococcaceae bacterium]|jgi:hypothetical protein|nr:hypothetical protein [Myxococcaceae bacterium]